MFENVLLGVITVLSASGILASIKNAVSQGRLEAVVAMNTERHHDQLSELRKIAVIETDMGYLKVSMEELKIGQRELMNELRAQNGKRGSHA